MEEGGGWMARWGMNGEMLLGRNVAIIGISMVFFSCTLCLINGRVVCSLCAYFIVSKCFIAQFLVRTSF
jgi:hypothetical protein